ncbi:MAG: ATP-binding protein [Blautia hansenii]
MRASGFLMPSFEGLYKNSSIQQFSPTMYINGKELSQLLNFPRKSVSGIMIAEIAEFGRNVLTNNFANQRTIQIGNVFHMGKKENSPVTLNIDSLTSHCFVTGSTGSGKSNTVYKLIEEVTKEPYNVPFLVIEPAKGEYRDEFRNVPNINLFSTNPQIDQMLKLNPFAFCEGIHVLEHLDRLVEIFNGCWEMYAAMPAILKEAIEEAYVTKGWDLLNSVFMSEGEPVFPTFMDVLQELPKIINNSEYSSDTKGDYIGALVTRVNSMTNGIYGQVFCDEFEVDNTILFDESTIVDLSRVGSSETKALIMGILVLKLTEYRMTNVTSGNSILKHLTILEEAHNILKNSKNVQNTTGSNVISKSVEMIVNSIAEMRTYGEGFIIVDQSPTSVDIAAIKNTNTKIIMRLPEEEDCRVAGHSVSLTEQQVNELAKLETGVAVIMQNNWYEPVLVKINQATHIFVGSGKPITLKQLKEFRSVVLSELIEQFEITDEQDISKVIRKVESFDILPAKKEEMLRMLRNFYRIMAKEYDSILFGRTMLRLIGCNDAFRRAEKYLIYKEDAEGNVINSYTEESLADWYGYIEEALPQYISVQDTYREIVKQYILHSKRFENHDISYSTLYRQIYKEIK